MVEFIAKISDLRGLDILVNPGARDHVIEKMKYIPVIKNDVVVGNITNVDINKNEISGYLYDDIVVEFDNEIKRIISVELRKGES